MHDTKREGDPLGSLCGATAISIQQLAGHENMQTTLAYMHLAKGETERAIRLLDDRSTSLAGDNIAATEGDSVLK